MKFQILTYASMALLLFMGTSQAQQSAPEAMKAFQWEVGTWNAEIRMYGDPEGQPEISKGTETIFMLGDMWLISHFKGEMMGMKFEGSSQMSFNPQTKKYTGTWVDSMSPYAMSLEGTWDEQTKTLTQVGTGMDESGNEMKMKMTNVHNDDGSRLFTMYMQDPGGNEMKAMEIHYTKAK
ncbi:MAG TPA: DUF1579 domain-containing protein [Pirellulaceae bacterium]|nr:DUF1579 domain-containing protein [Pirellulaceae bacterium]HMO91255.1 DUF1579 domain-containing protein [Pirellulaceae bacterium]HMP68561.1 DUF1579 domain-containing protein [Pirellulaceae bacterium]